MDEAIKLLQKFFQAEYEERKALIGPSYEQWEKKAEAVSELVDGFEPETGPRSPSDTADDLKPWASAMGSLKARKLFLVREYKDKKQGSIFRGYADDNLNDLGGYVVSLFVKPGKKGMKVVGWYLPCAECNSSGKVGSSTCPDCKGFGWKGFGGGVKVDHKSLGAPVSVKRLTPPTSRRDLKDYEAD